MPKVALDPEGQELSDASSPVSAASQRTPAGCPQR